MTFPHVSEWADLMPHTVTVAELDGVNGYNEETYSTSPSSYSARVVYKPTRTVSFAGVEVVASVTVVVASTSPFNATDQITLPDGSTPPLISISQYPGPDGLHHQTLLMGRG